jgi:hypothetical protein
VPLSLPFPFRCPIRCPFGHNNNGKCFDFASFARLDEAINRALVRGLAKAPTSRPKRDRPVFP